MMDKSCLSVVLISRRWNALVMSFILHVVACFEISFFIRENDCCFKQQPLSHLIKTTIGDLIDDTTSMTC